jgi:hypothetical protein
MNPLGALLLFVMGTIFGGVMLFRPSTLGKRLRAAIPQAALV